MADSMSKKHRISFIAVSLMAVSLLPAAKAQENNNSKPEEAATSAIAKKVINLWPGVAPGHEGDRLEGDVPLKSSRNHRQDSRPEWSRFSFPVGLFHPLQCAGLSRRSLTTNLHHKSSNLRPQIFV